MSKQNFLGIDVGTSSIKVSILNGESGNCIASTFYPKHEANIISQRPGWAEQHPEDWWQHFKIALQELKSVVSDANDFKQISAIGISYQMHGLVLVDKNHTPIRPAIIWCDSRAVEIGARALQEIGESRCLENLLNSPGNFTASKLKWVKENEKENYRKIYKIMLPGDFMAMKLTGKINTTASALSEGIFWDFKNNKLSSLIMDYFGFEESLIPEVVDIFANQGQLSQKVAEELGLPAGIPVAYRAGDQINNAFALNVLSPGEIAANAGTSGVIYAVTDTIKFDPQSRVNTFLHLNHKYQSDETRLGVLLCLNGTGILYSWLKKMIGTGLSYQQMNQAAAKVPIGSQGLKILPFGNGAERIFNNKIIGSHLIDLNFNIHSSSAHIFRAAQEGIAFAFKYGIDILRDSLAINPTIIRAGKSNLFLSPLFTEILSNITGAKIELLETDGALGAARGAAVGCGYYRSFSEAFRNLAIKETYEYSNYEHSNNEHFKSDNLNQQYQDAYHQWCLALKRTLP